MARLSLIPSVYVLLEKDGKYLFTLREGTGYQDGNYQVPSGHAEEHETPRQAAAREAREEVGVKIDPADLEFVHAMYRMHDDHTGYRVEFLFMARSWKGDPSNTEPDKCGGIAWFAPEEIPSNTIPYIRKAFQDIMDGIAFSEFVF